MMVVEDCPSYSWTLFTREFYKEFFEAFIIYLMI